MLPLRRTVNGWGDMQTMRREMQDLFDAMNLVRPGEGQILWAPAMDVREDSEALLIDVELPGVSPDDIDINIEDGVLTVTGEKRQVREHESGTAHAIERRYGRFERSITLGRAVDMDRIDANYEDGVLHVRIPKAEESRPRKVRVQSGRAAGKQETKQETTKGGQNVGAEARAESTSRPQATASRT